MVHDAIQAPSMCCSCTHDPKITSLNRNNSLIKRKVFKIKLDLHCTVNQNINCPYGRDNKLIEYSFQSDNFQYNSVPSVQLQNIGQLTYNHDYKSMGEGYTGDQIRLLINSKHNHNKLEVTSSSKFATQLCYKIFHRLTPPN